MNTIKQNLVNVRSHIDTAAQKCGRSPDEITLLAVSKTKPVSDIEKAIACGQTEFAFWKAPHRTLRRLAETESRTAKLRLV